MKKSRIFLIILLILLFAVLLLIIIILLFPTVCMIPAADKPAAAGFLYEIRMPAPHTHYLEISITIEKPCGKYIDIAMPAWSPGRYIIYDFAKHVHHVEVSSKSPKTPGLKRLDKQTWRISGFERNPSSNPDSRNPYNPGQMADSITLTYKVYVNYASGTFSHLSSEGAIINGASVFMYPVRAKKIPITLAVHLPEGKEWSIATGLRAAGINRFYAENYEHLIDSPLSIGNIRKHTFTSFGKPIHICFLSPIPEPENEKILALNCKAMCDAAGELFGGFPFSDYLFIFHIGFTPGRYDGMEHRNSTCITDPGSLSSKSLLKKLTALAGHEFWHVWNIKCIRPADFLSYNLEKEMYTQSLWIAEGITRYFENVLQLRAGIITRADFRINLAHYITTYELKPGKKIMTLEEASFLRWLEKRPDEDSNWKNVWINYYNKGAVVGLLLDMKIRGLTKGRSGVEDVFKNMYDSYYKKGRGYTNKDFYAECEKVAGEPLHTFFSTCVQSTAPLPYSECAGLCGFIIENSKSLPVVDLGIVLSGTRIANIIPGSAAEKAGFQKYDKILKVNGSPFPGKFDLSRVKPGQTMDITILRYGKEMTLPLVAGEKVPISFVFKETVLIPKEIAAIREAFYTGQLPGEEKKLKNRQNAGDD